MKAKQLFICFSGIDGTGKTTLSKTVVEALRKKGVNCRYVYGRWKPIISKPFVILGNLLFLRKLDIFENYNKYSNTKKNLIKKHSFLSRLYQQILLFDYGIQIFFNVQLPLLFGKSIVCDRYLYDTVVTDLAIDLSYSLDDSIHMLEYLFNFFPKPDIAFLIDVSEEIAYHRKDDTPSLSYLKERRKMYLDIGKKYDMKILDGASGLKTLQNEIERQVFF